MVMGAGLGAVVGGALGLGGSIASGYQSSKEARRNRQFQERMSNTAYQRAARDLEAAGLNRILAIGSPATTPGGSVATFPDYGASLGAGITAGANVAATAQQIDQSKAQTQKILQETDVLDEKEKQELQKTALWEKFAPMILEAGDNFQVLENFLSDPMSWKTHMETVDKTSGYIIGYLDEILTEIYRSRYENSELAEFLRERAGKTPSQIVEDMK